MGNNQNIIPPTVLFYAPYLTKNIKSLPQTIHLTAYHFKESKIKLTFQHQTNDAHAVPLSSTYQIIIGKNAKECPRGIGKFRTREHPC